MGDTAMQSVIPPDANREPPPDPALEANTETMDMDHPDAAPSNHYQQSGDRLFSDHLTPTPFPRSSTAIVESSGLRTVSLAGSEVATQGKRKRSRSLANESGELEVDRDSTRAPDILQPAPKRPHKKGPKYQPVHIVSRPKAHGPQQGIITLQEGETLLGGTLGMILQLCLFETSLTSNNYVTVWAKMGMSNGYLRCSFLCLSLSRVIPLVGRGGLGGGSQGCTHECLAKQSDHSTQ